MSKINKLLVIVGSAKAGTTSLAKWLGQRDDMMVGTIKEGRYFAGFDPEVSAGPASDGFIETLIRSEDDFDANFPALGANQWAIDASTDYIWAPETDVRLSAFAQDCEVKVICIAREPVSRAVSEYNHTLRHGWETLSFAESLDAEETRRAAGWHPLFYHKRRSQIADDITRFHKTFGDDLLVLDYADMRSSGDILARVSAFLDLDDKAVDTSQTYNVSYLEKNKLAGRLKKNKTLIAIGRFLLPSWAKKRLWDTLHVDAKQKVTVTEAEKAAYRALMADEITACKENPLVPTTRW